MAHFSRSGYGVIESSLRYLTLVRIMSFDRKSGVDIMSSAFSVDLDWRKLCIVWFISSAVPLFDVRDAIYRLRVMAR